MIVVRHSVVVDQPVRRMGHLWADFVRRRMADGDFVPDEWLATGGPHGFVGAGHVEFEAVSVGRARVTLSIHLDLDPAHAGTGEEVEGAYHRAVADLDRFHHFADAHAG